MKTVFLVSIITVIGISFTALVFVYQDMQNCQVQGGTVTGFLQCSKSDYDLVQELFQQKYGPVHGLVIDGASSARVELTASAVDGSSITMIIHEGRSGPYRMELICKNEALGTTKIPFEDINRYLQQEDCFSTHSENILVPNNAVLQVTADAPCAWMTLQKLPHSELLKQHDRTGRNALMLEIDDDGIDKVPHLKEMLTAMQSESGFEPYEYDENIWQKRITSTESEQQQIWDWLKETSDSQLGQTTDSSFTTYFTYRDNYYHIIWALC